MGSRYQRVVGLPHTSSERTQEWIGRGRRATAPASSLRAWLAELAQATYPELATAPIRVEPLARRRHLYSLIEEWRAVGNGQERRLVLKRLLLPNESSGEAHPDFGHEFRVLRDLWPVFQRAQELRVPRPLGLYPALGALVMEWVPGTRLDRLLRFYPLAPAGALQRALARCGVWLGTMHRATGRDRADLQTVLRQTVGDARREAEECRRLGLSADLAGAALEFVLAEAPRAIERSGVALCHGDFGPGNVLATAEGVTVIDFVYARRGAALEDVAFFLGMVEWLLGPRFGPELHAAFVEGYQRERAIDPRALACLQVAQMLKLAAWSPALRSGGAPLGALRRRLKRAHLARWLRRHLHGSTGV